MIHQEMLLGQYMRQRGNPPYRVIAEETGIQMSRVFRLFNGHEMRVGEYQIFEKLVYAGTIRQVSSLLHQCTEVLAPAALRELEKNMKRKLQLAQLKTTGRDGGPATAVAPRL